MCQPGRGRAKPSLSELPLQAAQDPDSARSQPPVKVLTAGNAHGRRIIMHPSHARAAASKPAAAPAVPAASLCARCREPGPRERAKALSQPCRAAPALRAVESRECRAGAVTDPQSSAAGIIVQPVSDVLFFACRDPPPPIPLPSYPAAYAIWARFRCCQLAYIHALLPSKNWASPPFFRASGSSQPLPNAWAAAF